MTGSKQHTNRIQGLDLIRVFATFDVVLIHCLFQIIMVDKIETFYNLSTISKIFYFGSVTIGALGVPLFLMLSGYLLLARNYDQQSTMRFYKHNLLPLFLTWEVWIPINAFIAWYHLGFEIHKTQMLKTALFIESSPILHFWYLPVIIGIYLFIPPLSRALKAMTLKEILIPLTAVFIFVFLIPSLGHFKVIEWDTHLDLNFSGGMYGFYIILGYVIHRVEQQIKVHFNKGKLIALIVALSAIITLIQIWIHSFNGSIWHIWYHFFLIPPAVVAIFLLLKDITFNRLSSLIAIISTCSFGIYLIHMTIIQCFGSGDLLNFTDSMEVKVLMLTILVMIFSFLPVFILRKVPYLGRLLFR